MRLKLSTTPVTVAQESVTSRMLLQMGASEPDMLTTIMSINPKIAPLMALLDFKGYKTSGLNYGTKALLDGGNYTTVSSNHVQYRIAFSDTRKEYFRANVDGLTFIDDAHPTQPGYGKIGFYVYIDSNVIGGKDVILLADGKTQLYVANDEGGVVQPGGVWRYFVKVNGNQFDEYVDPALLADGQECALFFNQHEQDFSKFGNEYYTLGNGWGDAYLTLQRLKYSYSGTAAAMDKNRKATVTGNWVYAGGDEKNKSFLSYADQKMLEKAAMFLHNQLLEGKQTVSVTDNIGKVMLTDNNNQEILAGSGALYSGDGPIEYAQSNGWSKKWIESFLQDIATHVREGQDGKMEVLVMLPSRSYMEFCTMMANMNVTADDNIEGAGGEKIVNNTYKGYELGGLRMTVVKYDNLNSRPSQYAVDGVRQADYTGIVLPLGNTGGGNRGAELISLRPMVRGTVAGIDKGGNVSSSIDGSSEHILFQNGIVYQNQPIMIYRPI